MNLDTGTILIIGLVWPEPQTTAAGQRMLQLLNFFVGQGYHVTFASQAEETDHSYPLETLGIHGQKIELNNSSFNLFAEQLRPDIVVFDRFLTEEQFGWRVAESVPDAIRILDTEDLHSLRKVRETLFKSNRPFTHSAWLGSAIAKRELASIFRSDLSLVISSFEMELLVNTVKVAKNLLLHFPFQLENIGQDTRKEWEPYTNRKDFICIGNGRHAPNVDAIVWLKTKIWPHIRKTLPKANVFVYGAYLPEPIKQMDDPGTGFCIAGWAPDLQKVMGQGRINLAPLRFGAGIKGKLIDAMLNGTPSVTTAIGAEGMHGNLNWNGHIQDQPKQFAASAVALYSDEVLWKEAQQNGTTIVNTLYNKDKLDSCLLDRIASLKTDLTAHRTTNFIGAMLQHQTLASTKYMSKWIEAKNN